jgi:hypothetical protein
MGIQKKTAIARLSASDDYLAASRRYYLVS